MSRFQIPSPPRRERSSRDREEGSRRRSSNDGIECGASGHYNCSSIHRDDYTHRMSSVERRDQRDGHYYRSRSHAEKERHSRRSAERRDHSRKRKDRDEHSQRRQKHDHYSHPDE